MKTQEPVFEVQIDEAAKAVLSEDEVQQIQSAFRAGARGSLIIGLKDGKRLLPQFLPDGSSETTTDLRFAECLDWLRRIGCDGYVHVSRIFPHSDTQSSVIVRIEVCTLGAT
ncbi:MAG: hypothetical protein WCL39_12355, partial [Armatimonadota bacterium]